MEPGITIGTLNRLLQAEGLTLGVVPEVRLRNTEHWYTVWCRWTT